tara:strand:+ start:510 stop:1388 length:879 start_codon:yes stop_codon:yes gene_type:complete
MGIFRNLFGGKSGSDVIAVKSSAPERSKRQIRIEVSTSLGGEQDLVKLSGTTTFARDAITRLAQRHSIDKGGYLEVQGSLQREPENPADPMAVAVHVEGEKVGYLPGYVARDLRLSSSGARSVRVQIFTELLPKGLRAEAWAWLGAGAPRWQWTSEKRPPLSSAAKAAAHQADVNSLIADALAGGGQRANQFEVGMVNGVHYLQLVEPIKQLKREDRLDEALTLCLAAIEGAEAARDGREPAPWYTEQAAIIYRKLGRREEEVAVLRRWLAVCPPEHREGSRIKARLDKIEA